MNYFLRWILIFTIFTGCEDHFKIEIDQSGYVTKTNYLWRKSLVNGVDELGAFIKPIEVGEKVVLMGANKSGDVLKAFDVFNETEIWAWRDFNINDWWSVDYYYEINNTVLITSGANFYSIDLGTGKTQWKDKLPYQINRSGIGINDQYFFSGYLYQEEIKPWIYRGDVNLENYLPLIQPNIDSLYLMPFSNVVGYVEEMAISKDEHGDELLLIPYLQFVSEYDYLRLLSLYDLTKEIYIFDKILISNEGYTPFQGQPKIFDNKIYLSCAERLYCLDLYTGEKIWDYPFENGLFRYDISGDILVANGEDTYLYGFDPWTGEVLWKEESAGRPSELKFLNGVVYYTTGGDGRLHAVDIRTGKHIWKLKCPDKNYDANHPFKSDGVAVFAGKNGKKGRIVASGFINAYCYEAVR